MIIEKKLSCNILATTQRGSQKTQTNIIIVLLLLDRLSEKYYIKKARKTRLDVTREKSSRN